jgi:hypothetical protein
MHLAQERHEYRRLARASGPDDQIEATLLEDELVINVQAEGLAGRRECTVGGALVRPREGSFAETDVGLMRGRGVCDGLLRWLSDKGIEQLSLGENFGSVNKKKSTRVSTNVSQVLCNTTKRNICWNRV